jgi:predicted kinase
MANLINFMGAPGVGKSYLARKLSEKAGIYFFDRDIMYDEIFSDNRGLEGERKMNESLTKSVWVLAIENAKRGIPNIIESPMTQAIQGKSSSFIDNAFEVAKEYNFKVSLIYCIAPEEVILTNLERRGCPRDKPKYENWQYFVQTFLNVPGPIYKHLRADTTNPTKENLESILAYLS